MRPPKATSEGKALEAVRSQRLLVIAPHLDDSPLSAFGLMRAARAAGSPVESVTVFTGVPADGAPSHWDVKQGFTSSTAAMSARMEEDACSMAKVGVPTRYLGLPEELYRAETDTDRVLDEAERLVRELVAEHDGPTILAIPAGLGEVPGWVRLRRHKLTLPVLRVRPGGLPHTDHVLLRRRMLPLALELAPHVIVYEDLPYAWGGGYAGLIAEMRRGGRRAVREHVPVDLAAKVAAIECYRSQRPGFLPVWTNRLEDVFEDHEHVWWVSRPSAE
ncbi:MAG: PIG-L family deacetylase [Acidimicrobiales bacterium]